MILFESASENFLKILQDGFCLMLTERAQWKVDIILRLSFLSSSTHLYFFLLFSPIPLCFLLYSSLTNSVLCLYYSVFHALFPLLFSYAMYVCHFLFADFASSLYFFLYPIQRFVHFFLRTQYGTVSPEVFGNFQFPAIPIHKKIFFTKKKVNLLANSVNGFSYFDEIPCERPVRAYVRPDHP